MADDDATETKVSLAVIHAMQKKAGDDLGEIKVSVRTIGDVLTEHHGRICRLESWVGYIMGGGAIIGITAGVLKVLRLL